MATAGGAVIAAGIVVVLLVALLAAGTFYVIGGSSARDERISVGQAYAASSRKLIPFVALYLILLLVSLVGLLLFIVPGIIFIGRSALAPIAMFEENLGPIAALKRSFNLTKGHLNEMLGALFAGFFIGESYYSLLFGAISVSPIVGRYHDLRQLQESGAPKPKVHWLNYTYLAGALLVLLTFGLIVFTGVLGFLKAKNSPSSFTPYQTSTFSTSSSNASLQQQ
jgi:hypothetical protein